MSVGENPESIVDLEALRKNWEVSVPDPLHDSNGKMIPRQLIADAAEGASNFQEFTRAIFELKNTRVVDHPQSEEVRKDFRDELSSLLESSSDENGALDD